ncbi:hypothetical protein LK513_21825 [Enterobacter hormaechei]|nr:DNA methyltransferase [Enterobacter hormaechei]MCC2918433.1 hypothetical protein [Enterobacter hormaechei]UDV15164.1 hypothetical protein LJU47_23295 [Enterobacter hormaechei]
MNKPAVIALVITLLDAMGIGLIMPVLPSLLREYLPEADVANHYGILLALYAVMQVCFAPLLGNRHHPTEKPVQSLRPLIESLTRPGAIVLDPFAGSGSTCVAAAEASRRYIGIEMLEQYHAAGVRRLAQVERARRMPAANDGAFYPDWPEAA